MKKHIQKGQKNYQMVFVERKMPKGNEIRLSDEEYVNSEEWLLTQKID